MEGSSTNLPFHLTSFVGRQRELAEIKLLLSATRLLTLTGHGGSGKTRLALQVAAGLLDSFTDGVWLVELAPLSDPSLVSQTVASVFQVNGLGQLTPTEVLTNYLRSKNLLLLLDNCEHLIDACAYLAEALLRACPNVRILTTSREALNIAGETCFSVLPLAFPDPQHLPPLDEVVQVDSIRLFTERAQAANLGFQLTPRNVTVITRICYRLDGLPLAIELAAARVKTLGVEQISERLDNRFHLLTAGNRTALPRHQTLRAAIDWSYDLLPEAERVLFRRLSVFAVSWTLEAAEVVCGDRHKGEVLNLLSRLIDKSLVIAEERENGVRYRFLDTIWHYACEKLVEAGEAETWQTRHLEFYLSLAEQAEAQLLGTGQMEWFARLEAEHDNLRAALGRILEVGDAEVGLRLAAPLARFWYLRGYLTEGSEWFRRILARADHASMSFKAKALFFAAELAQGQSDIERASMLGEQSLALYRQLGDKRGIADALAVLGVAAHKGGDRGRAIDLLRQSLDLYREIGFKWGVALTVLWSADVRMRQGDIKLASALWAESLALFRELGDEWGIAFALGGSGDVARLQGHRERAIALFGESLKLHRKLGHSLDIPYSLEALALIASGLRQPRRAARLWGAAETWRRASKSPIPLSYQTDYATSIADARAQLGNAAFGEAWAEGRALTLEQAIAEAEALTTTTGKSPMSSTPEYPAGLTPREVQVLRLLAKGLNNQQIADQLVLSKRTVHAHLRSIYDKLDVTTRSAAIRAAIELKIV